MYLKNTLNCTIVIEDCNGLKLISAIINIKSTKFKITGLYRCHDLKKESFLKSLKVFLNNNKNFANHCLVGDFNFNLMNLDEDCECLLNSFLVKGYLPNFSKVTMTRYGSCFDNVYSKLFNIKTKSFIYQNELTDHYSLFFVIDINSHSYTEKNTFEKKT